MYIICSNEYENMFNGGHDFTLNSSKYTHKALIIIIVLKGFTKTKMGYLVFTYVHLNDDLV